VTESALGKQVFAKAVSGKRADFIGNPDLPPPTATCPTSPQGWPHSALTPARSVRSGTSART
jgi:hypothetical protein